MGDVSYSTEGGGKSKNLYCIHGLDHEVWLQKQVVFSCCNGGCNMDFMLGLRDGNSLLVCTSFTGGGCRSSTGSLAGHVYHRCFAHSGPAQLKKKAASSGSAGFRSLLLR